MELLFKYLIRATARFILVLPWRIYLTIIGQPILPAFPGRNGKKANMLRFDLKQERRA